MLVPGDVLTDADLLALDSRIAEDFGAEATDLLNEKRRIAVQDWLAPQLEAAGFHPTLHRTRHQPSVGMALTAGVYADLTGAMGDATADDVALATRLATPASDALFVGYRQPFHGLYLGMTGTVNALACVSSFTAWTGSQWTSVGAADGTVVEAGKALSGGGRLTWTPPDLWARRAVNGSSAFWVRWQVSSSLTPGTAASQILPIVRSRLSFPVGLYTLGLVYLGGASGRRGAWLEQAGDYQARAEKALASVLPLIADEFDTDADDAVSTDDINAGGPSGREWTWERA